MSRFEGAAHEMGLKIGACPEDEGQFEVPFTVLEPGVLKTAQGRTPAIATSGAIEAWQNGEATVTVRIPGLESNSSVVALINGVRFRSRADDLSTVGGKCDPAVEALIMPVLNACPRKGCEAWDSGWHFAGASAQISAARVAGDEVTFTVKVGVKPGESPDVINGGDCRCYGADWPAGRATQFDVEVDYVVIAGAESDLKSTAFQIAAATTAAVTDWRTSPRANVVGEAGYASAFAGLTGFRVEMQGDRVGQSGRYVRELGLALANFTYERASGTGTATGGLAFSNQSAFPAKWSVAAEVRGVMVQSSDSAMRTTPAFVRGSVTNTSTNVARTPLDL